MRVTVGWAGAELQAALMRLSAQQARGVVRIVRAELEGQPISSLLDNPDQICTSTTYYGSGKRRGWRNKPEFQQALELARRDYRKWLLEQSTGEALVILAGTAPDAVVGLRQQIMGDRPAIVALEAALQASEADLRRNAAQQLGYTGLSTVVPALAAALKREKDRDVQLEIVRALGQIAGFRDSERRAAILGLLDRADVKTAAKQALAVGLEEIDALIEEELARLAGGSVGDRPED
jgi:hypothetical protein